MSIKDRAQFIFHKFKTDRNYQLGLMAVILVFGASVVWLGVWYSLSNQADKNIITLDANANTNTLAEKVEEVPAQLPRTTDGVIVNSKDANRQPIAVMIENLASDEVRPQFGLSQAQIVYEVIVESGITRFMAIFSSPEHIRQIGPVRSARPTYLEFASEYDALYVHAGGSPEALGAIDGLGIKDCSALAADSKYFWRDNNKYAPHNLFTSSKLLTYALRDKELLEEQVEFQSWNFNTADNTRQERIVDQNINVEVVNLEANANTNTEQATNSTSSIKIHFSDPAYEVEWKYDAENKIYQRYNGGQLHTDANNDEPLTTTNIIIQIVPPAADAGNEGRVNFNVTGEGPVYIFTHGAMYEGTWEKADRLSRTAFYDDNGQEIALNPGTIWVEILPEDRNFET